MLIGIEPLEKSLDSIEKKGRVVNLSLKVIYLTKTKL